MTDTSDKLIKSEIKGRNTTYYLTTAEDLENVKSNSLFGDSFVTLASLSAGGIISVILTRATEIPLIQQTTNVLDILLYVFICATVIFVLFGIFFHRKSFRIIEKIKGSGNVLYINKGSNQEEIVETLIVDKQESSGKLQFDIIKAVYWTSKASLDVTEELRNKIVGNKLNAMASNRIKGDPEPLTRKKLTIEYRFEGNTVTKEFTEGERILIP